MKKVFLLVICLVGVFNLSGCGFVEDVERASKLADKVESLEKEVKELKELTATLRVLSDIQDNSINAYSKVIPVTAFLSPSDKGYSLVASPGGYFSISIKDIKEYATGSEVSMQITNLLGVGVTGVALDIGYYPVTPDEGTSSLYSCEKKTTEHIARIDSGKAVTTTVRLPAYKPDNVNFITVSVGVAGIQYLQQIK